MDRYVCILIEWDVAGDLGGTVYGILACTLTLYAHCMLNCSSSCYTVYTLLACLCCTTCVFMCVCVFVHVRC